MRTAVGEEEEAEEGVERSDVLFDAVVEGGGGGQVEAIEGAEALQRGGRDEALRGREEGRSDLPLLSASSLFCVQVWEAVTKRPSGLSRSAALRRGGSSQCPLSPRRSGGRIDS